MKIINEDCLISLRNMPENSIDAVVTDPPYELGFMGKSWDASGIAFCPDTWREVLRVMKPGAHLVAFGAPKNYHRLACAIEDAGFEIRDSLMWVFGSGFPKSHNISKAIDAAAGAEREIIERRSTKVGFDTEKQGGGGWSSGEVIISAPATDEAKQWEGWGTALKPAYEPIVLARKPLSEKTIAANVLRWGTGALNIDATRIATNGEKISPRGSMDAATDINDGWSRPWMADEQKSQDRLNRAIEKAEALGRWPANLCHDGAQGVLELFPQSKSTGGQASLGAFRNGDVYGKGRDEREKRDPGYGDEGSAARFFYCAKASKQDRAGSKHPTVKPINLMRWLIRMVTPPNGLILDPFGGSGTTAQAAILEKFDVIIIEKETEYYNDICKRMENLYG